MDDSRRSPKHSLQIWDRVLRVVSRHPITTYILLVIQVSLGAGIMSLQWIDQSASDSEWQRHEIVFGLFTLYALWMLVPWAAMLITCRVLRIVSEHVIADSAPPESPREGSGMAIRILTSAWIFPFVILPFSSVPDNAWLMAGSAFYLCLFALFVSGTIYLLEYVAMDRHRQTGEMEWRSVHRIRSDGDMLACTWVGASLCMLFTTNLVNWLFPLIGEHSSDAFREELNSMLLHTGFALIPTMMFSIIYPLSRALVGRQRR